MTVGQFIGADPVVQGDAAPSRENLAERRAKIGRQLDALAHITNHGLLARTHRAGQIAIGRDRANREVQLSGQIAQTFTLIRPQVHRGRVRAFRVQFQSFPALVFGQTDQLKNVQRLALVPDAPVGDAVEPEFHLCLRNVMVLLPVSIMRKSIPIHPRSVQRIGSFPIILPFHHFAHP